MARQAQVFQDSLAGGAARAAAGLNALHKQGEAVAQLYGAAEKDAALLGGVGLVAWKEAAAIVESAQRWRDQLVNDAASAVGAGIGVWRAAAAGLDTAQRWQALAKDVMSAGRVGAAFANLDVGDVGAASAALNAIADGTLDVDALFKSLGQGSFTMDGVIADAEPASASAEGTKSQPGWTGSPSISVTISLDSKLNLLAFLIALFGLWLQLSQNAEAKQRHAELLRAIQQLAAECAEPSQPLVPAAVE